MRLELTQILVSMACPETNPLWISRDSHVFKSHFCHQLLKYGLCAYNLSVLEKLHKILHFKILVYHLFSLSSYISKLLICICIPGTFGILFFLIYNIYVFNT